MNDANAGLVQDDAPRGGARASARRVWGLIYRHLVLYRGSVPRLVELMYWPVLQLLVWGFVTSYLASGPQGSAIVAAGVLLGGILLWEIALRSQIGFAISFLEEIWSRNLGHLFVSPLRPWELVAGLISMSLFRTVVGVGPAILLAFLLHDFALFAMGPVVVAFFALLLMMGWAVALFVTALILRYGAGAEAMAWSVLFGLTPFAAVFYPISTLPAWLRPVAEGVPAARVFEGMRAALLENRIAWDHLGWALWLNCVWLGLGAWIFLREFHAARVRGALLNVGE